MPTTFVKKYATIIYNPFWDVPKCVQDIIIILCTQNEGGVFFIGEGRCLRPWCSSSSAQHAQRACLAQCASHSPSCLCVSVPHYWRSGGAGGVFLHTWQFLAAQSWTWARFILPELVGLNDWLIACACVILVCSGFTYFMFDTRGRGAGGVRHPLVCMLCSVLQLYVVLLIIVDVGVRVCLVVLSWVVAAAA